jgi:hypothetical protein
MTTQAKTLYPAGFVETEGCNGPRLVRSQPSRETTGVTLEECEAKYGPVSRFPMAPPQIPQMQQHPQRPQMKLEKNMEHFVDQDLATFLNTNFKDATQDQMNQLLDTLVGKNQNTGKLLDAGLQDKLKSSFNSWLSSQSIMFYSNYQTGIFLFLMILLFFLIGLAIPI